MMTGSRLLAVVFIFVAACMAWVVLGQTINVRTSVSEAALRQDVDRMFGPRVVQAAPGLSLASPTTDGTPRWRVPDASEITVDIDHENRYRGLVWFSVYRVAFEGVYTFAAPRDLEGPARGRFRMVLPAEANVDALEVLVGDEALAVDTTEVEALIPVAAGENARVTVRYVTSGQDAWSYQPDTKDGGLRRFRLTARTNFDAIDYPATGLSPTVRARPRSDGKDGMEAVWDYTQMIPARNHTIGLVMPTMPDSGRLSARISLFAPVSLFFFFVVMIVIQVLKGWKLHPLNYLLIAAGFFAFHVLLGYLVDHLPIHLSFWIAALVSVALVVSYLRLVLGARAAILVAGGAQLVYLVFFSYAFFWQGWTGLTVVVGAVLTLFVIMQLTGRIDWDERLGRRPAGRAIARGPDATPATAEP